MAKKQPEVTKIYSVELNPDAHHYAQGNVVLNKLQGKVEAILMDAVLACSTVSLATSSLLHSLLSFYPLIIYIFDTRRY